MNAYELTVKVRVKAEDEDHAFEQALEMIADGQFDADIVTIA